MTLLRTLGNIALGIFAVGLGVFLGGLGTLLAIVAYCLATT